MTLVAGFGVACAVVEPLFGVLYGGPITPGGDRSAA